MLIAQISDTHIVSPSEKAYGIADTAKSLSACITHINTLNPKPDIVLVTGDITNNGKYEAYIHAKNMFDQLEAPYYVIPGNHDNRDDVWSVFSTKNCLAKHKGFINYVIEDHEIRFIALDSTILGKPGAEICSTRASWLDEQLNIKPDQPTIIFMHHPPVKCSILETDEDGFIGADLFGDVVEKHSNIKAILCGHIHLQAHINWRNTVVSIAPSTEMRLMLDLTMQKESQFHLDSPAFQIHYWTNDKNLISYPIFIRNRKKSYLFERICEKRGGWVL